ncbi:MAG: carbohydrate kinase, partial [Lachnospiraceae bacterium]|nr:carbohydrate kinase [Lachnospiraceae bacterium]
MKIAGLDIGTTGCKLTVFDERGEYLGKAYRDYPVRRQVSGHEIELSTMMDSVYEVITEMAEQYPDITGIGVTSFGEVFVMTNDAGEPLHTAMLYTDPRGKEECEELVEMLGAERIQQITGLAPHEMYSISKMMWIKKHHPEICEAARRIHLIEDFVVRHLTGKAQIDYSLASRTMA